MLPSFISLLFLICNLMLFIRIMGSWVESLRDSRFMHFIARFTDPYLNIFSRIIPPIRGVLDVSPILAFFVLWLLEKLIMSFFR
ncbi:MAG: YggT family protein [Chlamydiae bacterium]|nr:YggT family protein [Chlamydiota bacterium]